MERLRKAIEGKSQWLDLESYIVLVEENISSNPNVAIDGAKSVLESIAKTILENKGIDYKPDTDLNKLIKLAFRCLPEFSALSARDQQSSIKIITSLESISYSIGDLRNRHGFFSHGQDVQSDKCEEFLARMAIESSDLLTTFLITTHAKDFHDRKRIYYEDNSGFNEYFDEINPIVEIGKLSLSPSQVLFYSDIEAYKIALIDYNSGEFDHEESDTKQE
jgi:hypothetical protein